LTSYDSVGVDYDQLDAAKRKALAEALATSSFMERRGGRSIAESRGEPAFVFRLGKLTLALVQECLGTKSILCREYEEIAGVDRFDAVAYDTVAAIVNDLCAVGALPLVVNAYFATGNSQWYSRGARLQSLVNGWRQACQDAGATWGGGESPTLSGLVGDEEIELAGCGVGRVPDGHDAILGGNLAAGDEIVLMSSTGIHTNGLTLARSVAKKLSDGLLTRLPSGYTLGEALLVPSAIYVAVVQSLLEQSVPITYLSHITGHGVRKVMRARRELTYHLTALPPVPEVLSFIVDQAGMDTRSAWGTFNMGIGFAVFCSRGYASKVIAIAGQHGIDAIHGGDVDQGHRQVIIEPLGISFDGSELQLR
jgi:phosphoribosylformylglycinamidine cyclo-ligase